MPGVRFTRLALALGLLPTLLAGCQPAALITPAISDSEANVLLASSASPGATAASAPVATASSASASLGATGAPVPTTSSASTSLGAMAASAPAASASPLSLVGQKAPAISFMDTDGKSHTLAEFQGKYVLLTFFATWCPHCQAAMPGLQTLANQHQQANFVWVPIEASQDPLIDIVAFKTQFSVTATAYGDTTNGVSKGFNIQSFPTNYLMGPDGTLLNGAVGDEITQPAVYATFLPPPQ